MSYPWRTRKFRTTKKKSSDGRTIFSHGLLHTFFSCSFECTMFSLTINSWYRRWWSFVGIPKRKNQCLTIEKHPEAETTAKRLKNDWRSACLFSISNFFSLKIKKYRIRLGIRFRNFETALTRTQLRILKRASGGDIYMY